VVVSSDTPCPGTPPADGWTVRIQPGDAAAGAYRADATAVPADDGTFSVAMTVPAGMPPGNALVSIADYYDHVPCDDHGSCAQIATELGILP
jgi:hypothetical protein